jgi:hypothetical protein
VKHLEAVAARSQGSVAVHPESVDATHIPDLLVGCRTLFNALHHFRPDDARKILQSAVDARQPIAIFDVPERTVPYLVGILFAPIVFVIACPFLRPFDWRWIIFTYLIPVIPLFVVWDGLVSGLRAYSLAELDELVASLDADGYQWDLGQVKVGNQPAHITYLTGRPTDEAA